MGVRYPAQGRHRVRLRVLAYCTACRTPWCKLPWRKHTCRGGPVGDRTEASCDTYDVTATKVKACHWQQNISYIYIYIYMYI